MVQPFIAAMMQLNPDKTRFNPLSGIKTLDEWGHPLGRSSSPKYPSNRAQAIDGR
jgi:hypothetical protein